ncbi:MAG: ribonuclease P protein component [Bacteroidota bacterium]
MKKEETLRGRGAFARVYEEGIRIEGEILRCFARYEQGNGRALLAGFSVPAKRFNAVRRNRLRRLMRAAFDTESEVLQAAAAGGRLSVVFVFKGRQGIAAERLGVAQVSKDMESLCRRCVATLRPAER